MIDSDAFITNMTIPLTSIIISAYEAHGCDQPMDLIIAEDCNGPNAGVFLLRISEWSLDFLNQVWDINDPKIKNIEAWFENVAMVHLLRSNAEYMKHVYLAPQKQFNAYSDVLKDREKCNFARWSPGDFVYHFVGASKNTELRPFVPAIMNATAQGQALSP